MRSHIRALLSAALLVCAAAPAALAQSLPTPWNAADVGAPAVQGSASFGSGVFTVNGAGTDIGGRADQFYFVYRPLSGDGEIVARVDSLTRTDNMAKAGVMIREAMTRDSAYAMMTVTASRGHRFQRRPAAAESTISSSLVGGGPPGWLKIARTADTFVASWSTNGINWTTVATDTIPMGDTVYVGMAVTSRDRRRAARASISNVTVTSSSTGNQSPAVTITAPANNTQYSLPANVTIQATATDPENRMASVGFYVNNALVATDTTAPYSTPWSPSAAGTYTLSAMAQDADGGSSWSSNVTVTVQGPNSPPAVSLTSPAAGSTFSAPATITLAANASDSDGTIERVEFFNGSALLGTDTSQPYSFTWSNVAAGTYGVRAVAYDAAGANAASATVNVTVSGTTNTPPTVTMTSPLNGATFTAPATINLAATAVDAQGPIARVEFYSGTTLLWTEFSLPYADAWSNVPAGTYTLTAVAYDGQGAKTTSAPVRVTVNGPNRAPTVAMTSPAAGAAFTAPATINLTASASDPENQLARVEFLSGTTVLATDTAAPFAWTWANVPAGTYTLTARAFDAAGLSATSTAVSVSVAATAPPAAPTTVVFTASADHATNVTSYRLSVFAANANPATATPIATSDLGKPAPAANGEITVDRASFFSALAAGNYLATVTAIGPGGQTQSASVPFSR